MIAIAIEDTEALHDPVTALSQLLARPQPTSNDPTPPTTYIRRTGWLQDEDRREARDVLWEAFVRDFDRVVRRITAEWGPPDFRGAYDEPGYPEDLWWAPFLAYWVRGERVACVVCDQQDNKTPLELYLSTLPTRDLHPRQAPLTL